MRDALDTSIKLTFSLIKILFEASVFELCMFPTTDVTARCKAPNIPTKGK